MAAEASLGRYTPYELMFGAERLAEHELPAIAEEARRRGITLSRRDHFAGSEGVGRLLRRLVPETLEPTALESYLDILFHCYHFWDAGCPLYAFAADVVRDLVAIAPDLGSWNPRAPHPSLYVELPRNLFWAAVTEGEPPEPVEGLFVRLGPDQPPTGVDLLIALGMRPDRPGFSVAAFTASLEQTAELKEPGAFESEIPGADLAGIYSLQRPSEALLLTLRLLWYLDVYPDAKETVPGAADAAPQAYGYDVPTALDHHRVRLIGRSRG
ncbi:MAG: hypothetical protein AMS25_01580 [Gemmatimonas sp. SM23_52]|nr:MAG: hypothetical protein AMS25_01580 [Gemmatimonas sp. SM23_52]